MRRFLFTTGAVLALALPAAAQDAEVGEEYGLYPSFPTNELRE